MYPDNDDLRGAVELGNPDFYLNHDEEEYRARTTRLKEREGKIIYFESKEFKEDEKLRMAANKPKEHYPIGFNRTYCPIYDKIRPEWLCANEHGDKDEPDRFDFEN